MRKSGDTRTQVSSSKITRMGHGRMKRQGRKAAKRKAANCRQTLLRLPAELRNRIYGYVVPRNQWFTAFIRSNISDLALLQVCHSIRSETVPMYYGDNTFAIDLTIDDHYLSALKWINGLSADAVASLRKVRISTRLFCLCKEAVRASGDHSIVESIKISMSFAVSINKTCEEEPFGVLMESCCYCGERPIEAAAQANKYLEGMELDEEENAVSREDLLALIEILNPISNFGDYEELFDGD
ncbi:hypothetical protein LTR37_013613 [Vermiconidia calcicola]|uniref:Uncharacterized protein n=1 Tax=Vermiconidia calcicola TaxID=1690605 RepID=A0ACC3MXE2_9PEZI|nr:hypothetical protein LTR37_013613 [Vermiconidia calcicola]